MSWVKIDSTTLESAAASVTFSSGLSGYKFFRLTVYAVDDTGNLTAITLNGDTGTKYDKQRITAVGTSVNGSRDTGDSNASTSQSISTYASSQWLIAKPSASVKAQITSYGGAASGSSINLGLYGYEWDNTTDAITSIEVFATSGSIGAGTSVLLEGLAF